MKIHNIFCITLPKVAEEQDQLLLRANIMVPSCYVRTTEQIFLIKKKTPLSHFFHIEWIAT